MGFFAEFSAWLNSVLVTYIATNTARVSAVLEPAIVTLAILYVIVWGYMQLTAKIDEPVFTGIRRIFLLGVILSVSLRLWSYNEVIVNTFFDAPGELAASIVGAYSSVEIVDEIIFTGGDVAGLLIQKGGILDGNFSFYLAGFMVYAIVGLTAVYTVFLFALSKIALSVLLALGPLFFALLMFETTKRFFESWLAQLANYAFVAVLTVLVAALMLHVIATAAEQAATTGAGIEIAHAVRVCMTAALTFLVMRQVMPMAAGLASGLALSTFGAVSAALAWGFGGATRTTREFTYGLTDRRGPYRAGLSHRAGAAMRRGWASGARTVARGWRENAIHAR